MALSVVNSGQVAVPANGGADVTTVSFTPSAATGNYVVVALTGNSGVTTGTITSNSSAFTELTTADNGTPAGGFAFYVGYRQIVGGDTSFTFTSTQSGAFALVWWEIGGSVSSGSPLDIAGMTAGTSAGSPYTITSGSGTAAATGELVLLAAFGGGADANPPTATVTTPTGFTKDQTSGTTDTGAANLPMMVGYHQTALTSSTTIGAQTVTFSGGNFFGTTPLWITQLVIKAGPVVQAAHVFLPQISLQGSAFGATTRGFGISAGSTLPARAGDTQIIALQYKPGNAPIASFALPLGFSIIGSATEASKNETIATFSAISFLTAQPSIAFISAGGAISLEAVAHFSEWSGVQRTGPGAPVPYHQEIATVASASPYNISTAAISVPNNSSALVAFFGRNSPGAISIPPQFISNPNVAYAQMNPTGISTATTPENLAAFYLWPAMISTPAQPVATWLPGSGGTQDLLAAEVLLLPGDLTDVGVSMSDAASIAVLAGPLLVADRAATMTDVVGRGVSLLLTDTAISAGRSDWISFAISHPVTDIAVSAMTDTVTMARTLNVIGQAVFEGEAVVENISRPAISTPHVSLNIGVIDTGATVFDVYGKPQFITDVAVHITETVTVLQTAKRLYVGISTGSCTFCGSAVYCGGPLCPNVSLGLAPDGVPMIFEQYISFRLFNPNTGQIQPGAGAG